MLMQLSRQYPEFVALVARWRTAELEALPYGRDQLDVMRGRVQTLTEMQGMFTSSKP